MVKILKKIGFPDKTVMIGVCFGNPFNNPGLMKCLVLGQPDGAMPVP